MPKSHHQVGCFTEVVDSYGAVGSSTGVVQVLPAFLSVAALFNISEAKAAAAIEAGNADASKQVLAATTASIATSSAGSGSRRFLLGAASDTSALRASVLSNLWATYDITPTTRSDAASLLAVLAGILDTPSDVTLEVATGSLLFLETV